MNIKKINEYFYINTKKTSYVIKIHENYPVHIYYGSKIDAESSLEFLIDTQKYGFTPCKKDSGFGNLLPNSILLEYSGNNTGDYRTPSLYFTDEAGRIGCRLLYENYKIIQGKFNLLDVPQARCGENCETLVLTLRDNKKNLEVQLLYTVYFDEDVIVRSSIVKKTDNSISRLNKVASFTLDFNKKFDNVIELAGDMNCEHTLQKTNLSQGLKIISSTTGFSSHTKNPFFMIFDDTTSEYCGEVYGFNLSYSGSFVCEIQETELSKTRVSVGVSSDNFEWELISGESFYSPQGILTYSKNGFFEISNNFHRFIKRYILPEKWSIQHRPIVINTWEFSNFNVTENKVLILADKAKELNIQVLVLDDGWFRNNEKENLGDWECIKEKFPKGLGYLADRIREKGLKFGIWFEPEMVNIKSQLYSLHPDWILSNGDENYYGRNQLVLDFSNKRVVNFILEKICKIIDECKADYIKIDANRYLSEVGSFNDVRQGEIQHRRVLGLYYFLKKITEKYPDLLIETCAGGGGRFDLGMLHYSPQIWLSDNTDPLSRLEMHYGVSFAYPPSTISCHISSGTWLNGFNTQLEFRYMVASFGTFGYELNISCLKKEESNKIIELNKLREKTEIFSLEGMLYRLCDNDYYQAYMQVLENGQRALFTLLIKKASTAREFIYIKLKGLIEDVKYKNNQNELVLSGKTLMNAGIIINNINSFFQNKKEQNFNSKLYRSAGGVQILFENQKYGL